MIRHDYLGALCAGAFLQAGMLAAPAAAQTSEDQSAVIEEIVVVGTAIRGTPIDEPYAVSVVDREELEQQGSPLMVDLFKNLGASNGVVGERSGWYNSSLPSAILESVSNVNLRGLRITHPGAVERPPPDLSSGAADRRAVRRYQRHSVDRHGPHRSTQGRRKRHLWI